MNYIKTVAWLIIILMVLSGIGFLGAGVVNSHGQQNYLEEDYDGFTFFQQSPYWILEKDGHNYAFYNFPADLEDISLPIDLVSWGNSVEKVYLASLPNDTVDVTASLQQLGAVFSVNGIRAQMACVEEEGCGDIPILDCATNSGIAYQTGEMTTISQDKECLTVVAPTLVEFERITERIIYGFLGVMN